MLIYPTTLVHAVEVEVTNLERTHTVTHEEYKTVEESAWKGKVPPEASMQFQIGAVHQIEKA